MIMCLRTIGRRNRIILMATTLFCLIMIGTNAVTAGEPGFLNVGVGVFDMFDDETTAEFRSEYTFSERQKIGIFTPFVGLSGTAEAGSYVYGGIGLDLFFGKNVVATPNFASGIYGNGDGKDLGYAIEFRSGVNLSYRFQDYSRLGFSFHHISNAGLDDRNPGEESLLFLYSFPIQNLLAD